MITALIIYINKKLLSAAVYPDLLGGDVAGFIRHQEHDQVGDILGSAHPAQRYLWTATTLRWSGFRLLFQHFGNGHPL